jgi:hypothetical protein
VGALVDSALEAKPAAVEGIFENLFHPPLLPEFPGGGQKAFFIAIICELGKAIVAVIVGIEDRPDQLLRVRVYNELAPVLVPQIPQRWACAGIFISKSCQKTE